MFKRRPNNTGTVVKLQGKRRKPYCARRSYLDDYDKTKYKCIGYFATRKEALNALEDFNAVNRGVEIIDTVTEVKSNRTFQDLAKVFINTKRKKTTETVYWQALEKFKNIYDLDITKIKPIMLQQCFNDADCKSRQPYVNMRTVVNEVYKQALREGIDVVNPQDLMVIPELKKGKPIHTIFTREEIHKLWEDTNTNIVPLIMIYTGLRVGEFVNIQSGKTVIDLDNDIIDVKVSKTNAGVRKVPICTKIKPLIQLYQQNPFIGNAVTAINIFKKLGHLTHDARHTCVTLLTELNVQQIKIKKIVGHTPTDITGGVYTHLTNDNLLAEMNKLNAV